MGVLDSPEPLQNPHQNRRRENSQIVDWALDTLRLQPFLRNGFDSLSAFGARPTFGTGACACTSG